MRLNTDKIPPMEILARAGMVLDRPLDFAWTVQGFGMLRTYLDEEKRWRLNVWTPALRVPDVSEIHDHPWSFRSWVLLGQLTNIRFKVAAQNATFAKAFHHVTIKTGEGGGPVGAPDTVYLAAQKPEVYSSGDSYEQIAQEVHLTKTLPGTVTLNDRTPPTPEHTANVFWLSGDWVNAEPRPATPEEVLAAVALAKIQAENLARFGR